MVQTRRKTAAAAQDGTVKENKNEPPAPHVLPKRGKRGRPPKIKIDSNNLNTPSTSSTSQKDNKLKDEMLLINCDKQDSDVLLKNEVDSFISKGKKKDTSAEILPQHKSSLDQQKILHASTLKTSSNTIVSMKREIGEETLDNNDTIPTSPRQTETDNLQSFALESVSPFHPEDPQPSIIHDETNKPEAGPEELTNEQIASTDLLFRSLNEEPAENIPAALETPAENTKCDESESMDIADSESNSEDDDESQDFHNISSSSIPLPNSPPPTESKKVRLNVDVEHKRPDYPTRNEVISPSISRPKQIHFLHPAFASFVKDSGLTSPQPPPPPEPAPVREKVENALLKNGMSFKMTFKKALNNPLLKTSALDHPPSPPTVSSMSSTSAYEMSSSPGLPSESVPKRSSNFGLTSSSGLPPPQMVELPKLSFFNMPPTVFSLESDTSPEEHIPPRSKTPVHTLATPSRISESEIQALKVKAEKVAQDIARRHVEDKQREDKDEYERRRDDRDKRYKKSDFDRSEQRARQREDDERRAREREREVTKRHEREREEERLLKQKEEEKKRKEDDKRQKETEGKQNEEASKKPEEKKMNDEEMKVPEYEVISECKYLIKNANKKKTEALLCECQRTGGNCSDDSCVNRAMLTECPSSCPAKCKNQRFAKKKYASVEPYHTGTAKGCGLKALKDIKKGKFIIEYIGEVVERDDYEKRKIKYGGDKKHKHHYLCDTGVYTIDATVYGNASRFVNHSCDPNAICEKWSVPRTPGDVNRIGFFAKRLIKAGEEITFDYQFVNYGRDAQQCFCGATTCNGWIGQKLEDFSSDEEDDIVTTRHINMDEEEEEKLAELNHLPQHERNELINEMLEDLVIMNKKHARKVITIAAAMTDYAQRGNLLQQIFSKDSSVAIQSYYAKEGLATLMVEWLDADDYSIENLKLVQVIFQTVHGDLFLPYARSDRLLLDVTTRWEKVSLDKWVDIHVVANSLVACVSEPGREYKEACEEINKEIITNFTRVKEMAFRLNQYWFNRSVSFKIPKKVREPTPKDFVTKQQENNSVSQLHDTSRPSSPNNYRYQHSSYSNSYYNDRESHPRFFNNGNDVHQYRFTGYHGNNYQANYFPRRSNKDIYRDRRRFGGRRSRSRSRSLSPQSYKRKKLDERENHRTRSPAHDRRGTSPGEKTPGSSTSGERVHGRSEVKTGHGKVKKENEDASAVIQSLAAFNSGAHLNSYHVPPGYEAYGLYDPSTGVYMYHPGTGYYPSAYHQQAIMLTMETLPPNDRLCELYEKATLQQLTERLDNVRQECEMLRAQVERKRAENEAVEAARRRTEEEEARRQETIARAKYVWAVAKSDAGETYYYNKITKETQWAAPSAEQGLLDPNICTSPDTTAATSEDHRVCENQKTDLSSELQARVDVPIVKEEVVDEKIRLDFPSGENSKTEKSVIATTVKEKSLSPSKSNRDRERDRERREESRHRDNHRDIKINGSASDRRIRDFKQEIERSIRSVVRSHSRLRQQHESTTDKVNWLIKLIAKEMFKRESSQSSFDYRFSDNTDRKVKNYTKSLIDRKLESNDLWKGYSVR